MVARASGRLTRPREKLSGVVLPNETLLIAAAAALLAFLPGPAGEIAQVAAGAFVGAAALTGLAVLHAVTVGMTSRTALLVAAYALLILSGLPLFLFPLLGGRRSRLQPPGAPLQGRAPNLIPKLVNGVNAHGSHPA